MKLTSLKRASDFEVRDWMEESLQLTPYQKSVLADYEIIRFSPFYFYKSAKEKTPILWRFTLPLFPFYWTILVLFLPINWMMTGKWGYGRNFHDKFHSKWVRKLGL